MGKRGLKMIEPMTIDEIKSSLSRIGYSVLPEIRKGRSSHLCKFHVLYNGSPVEDFSVRDLQSGYERALQFALQQQAKIAKSV
jgi:hypothetical protein